MTVAITAHGECAPVERPEPVVKFVFLAIAAEIERQMQAYGLTGVVVEIAAAEAVEARSQPRVQRANAGGGR